MVYGPGGTSVRPRPRWSAATVSADSVNGCTNSPAEARVAPDAFRKSKGRPSPLRSKYVSIPLSWAVGTAGRYPSPIEEPRRALLRAALPVTSNAHAHASSHPAYRPAMRATHVMDRGRVSAG